MLYILRVIKIHKNSQKKVKNRKNLNLLKVLIEKEIKNTRNNHKFNKNFKSMNKSMKKSLTFNYNK